MRSMMSFHSVFATLAIALTIVHGQQTIYEPFKQCMKPGYVALTFDDGPSPYTPLLLDELEQANVTATFFVLGKQLNDTKLNQYTKQAFNKGHQIASHTMQHLHLPNLSDNDLRREVQNAEHNINKTIGRIPNYIRPPYGELNANNTRVLNDMGYIIVNWNLDSNDWRYAAQTKDQHMAFDNIVNAITKAVDNSSFITLQHDIHLFSVKLVPEIIKRIKAKGLKFTTVADCIGMPKPLYHDASITGANINNDGDGEPSHDQKFVPNPNASDMSDDMTDDSGLGEDKYSEHQSSSNAYANDRTIGMHRYLLVPILLLVACFSL